jgi:hypothetical protein
VHSDELARARSRPIPSLQWQNAWQIGHAVSFNPMQDNQNN